MVAHTPRRGIVYVTDEAKKSTQAASQTALDRAQTALDRAATAADRVQTALDRAATAADRVQTGLDRAATVSAAAGAVQVDALGAATFVPAGASVAQSLGAWAGDRVWGGFLGITADGTDCSAAFTDAIARISARGGGLIDLPFGTIMAAGVVLKSTVHLSGQGVGGTTVKAPPGANKDVFVGDKAYSLFGGNTSAGIRQWGLHNLVIDGNKSAQTATGATIDACNGLAYYGYGYTLENVRIQNVLGHGVRSEWYQFEASVDPSMEGTHRNIKIVTTGRHGWWFKGPHDAHGDHVIVIDASQEADNAYCGLYTEGAAGRFFNFHAWHKSTTVNRMKFAASSSGGSQFVACHFEGGRGLVEHRGTSDQVVCSQLYAFKGSAGSSLVVFSGGGRNTHVANQYVGVPGLAAYAIQLGTAEQATSGNQIRGATFTDFDAATPFNFLNDGGNNQIQGTGFTANAGGSSTPGGTKNSTTVLDYQQRGNTTYIASPATAAVAQTADGTVANGNARGQFAVDFQQDRFQANQISGGGHSGILWGYANVASNLNSYVGVGGHTNSATGIIGAIFGKNGADRGQYGSFTFASGSFATNGDAQWRVKVLRAAATGATPARATEDGATATNANTVNVPIRAAFAGRVTAVALDTVTFDSAMWTIDNLLVSRGASGAPALVGTPTITRAQASAGASAWTLTVAADATNSGLTYTVTGSAGAAIRLVLRHEGPEVTA